MATVSLEDIKTKERINPNDTVRFEIIQGKFNLSFQTSLSTLGSFFLRTTDLDAMTSKLDSLDVWLNELIDYSKDDYLMAKDTMENKFLSKTESDWFYKRILTDQVMENVCAEYAKEKSLSAMVSNCQEYGQARATALGNALATHAAIVKTQNIINDTNCQLNVNKIDGIYTVADALAQSFSFE